MSIKKSIDKVESLKSHNSIGLHGLLRGELYLFMRRCCLYLTGNSPPGLHDLLRGSFAFFTLIAIYSFNSISVSCGAFDV
jgi:hypothetical protein